MVLNAQAEAAAAASAAAAKGKRSGGKPAATRGAGGVDPSGTVRSPGDVAIKIEHQVGERFGRADAGTGAEVGDIVSNGEVKLESRIKEFEAGAGWDNGKYRIREGICMWKKAYMLGAQGAEWRNGEEIMMGQRLTGWPSLPSSLPFLWGDEC